MGGASPIRDSGVNMPASTEPTLPSTGSRPHPLRVEVTIAPGETEQIRLSFSPDWRYRTAHVTDAAPCSASHTASAPHRGGSKTCWQPLFQNKRHKVSPGRTARGNVARPMRKGETTHDTR